jgi:DNA-binding XRE family transcriptional regulator
MKEEKERTVEETKQDISFDVRASAVFYEQWYQTIKDFAPKERDKAYKYIFEYAFYGIEPEKPNGDKTPPMSYVVFKMARPNIDSAQKRYDAAIENGNKGGRPKKVTEEVVKKIVELRKKGLTQTEVALEVGLSLKTIQRVEKDISQNHNVNVNENVNGNDDANVKGVASTDVNTETASPITESSTPQPPTPTELTYEEEVAVINAFRNRKKPIEISKELSLDFGLVNIAIDEYKDRGYKLPTKPEEVKTLDVPLMNGGYYSKTKEEMFNDATDNGRADVDDVAWEELKKGYIMYGISPTLTNQLLEEFEARLLKLQYANKKVS